MTKTQLVALLTELGIHPSRKLGQNFLIDPNLLEALVRDAAPLPGERILEIGPGTGVLTRRLLAAGCRVTAVEIDHRLAAYLRTSLGAHPDFQLIEADACRLDFDDIMGGGAYRCIANLPYACSSVILAHMARLHNPPNALSVLLQREMAERLAAVSGTREYVYDVQLVRHIPPAVFYPPPEVGSVSVRLDRHAAVPAEPVRLAVAALARIGFGQRRKKMLPLLATVYGRREVEDAFAALDISSNLRAEGLAVDGYVRLAEALDAPQRR